MYRYLFIHTYIHTYIYHMHVYICLRYSHKNKLSHTPYCAFKPRQMTRAAVYVYCMCAVSLQRSDMGRSVGTLRWRVRVLTTVSIQRPDMGRSVRALRWRVRFSTTVSIQRPDMGRSVRARPRRLGPLLRGGCSRAFASRVVSLGVVSRVPRRRLGPLLRGDRPMILHI